VRAFEISAATMKSVHKSAGVTVESIEKTKEDLADAMADQQQLEEALGGGVTTAALEEEFEDDLANLMKEVALATPPSSPSKSEVLFPSVPTDEPGISSPQNLKEKSAILEK